MPDILHKAKNAFTVHESESDSDSIKQRQNSEMARQNGTHPDVQKANNKSIMAYIHRNGRSLGDTSRSYPEDLMTSGTVGVRDVEVANLIEQRRTQEA